MKIIMIAMAIICILAITENILSENFSAAIWSFNCLAWVHMTHIQHIRIELYRRMIK